MNRLTIIGNLVRDPELRTTPNGINVCTFTVAVNRKNKQDGKDEADYFRVSAWRGLADTCSKYLAKGRKVAVVGSISLHTWDNNGKHGASMEVNADEVEFLAQRTEQAQIDPQSGKQIVNPDDLPY